MARVGADDRVRGGGQPTAREGFATRAVHGGQAPAVHQVPASVPIYQTSLYRFDSLEEFAGVIGGERAGYVYGRGYGNPTVEAFEALMADLEGTEAAMAFDSGMAAIHTTVTTLARNGDRIVASRHLYGGTSSLFTEILPRYGIEVRLVDPGDADQVGEALEGAALFYVETIGNPLLEVFDLRALAEQCAAAGVPSVVDNTFASPYLCNPAALGFDYVLHSATKYIGGHSDLIGGVVCTSAGRRAPLRAVALDQGGAMQPFEAWLCLRGLTTLSLRMARHCETAGALAEVLRSHPAVARVHYPGLDDDPFHGIACRQLRGAGGVVAVELEGGLGAAERFCQGLRLAWIAGSLGGSHTLVAHPASTTHRQVEPEARRAQGITDGLLRVSVGLEEAEDILVDVAAALDRVG